MICSSPPYGHFICLAVFDKVKSLHFEAIYQYDDEDGTELNQHIIVTDKEVNCYNIWNHYFNRKTLLAEIQYAGFANFEFYGDVAGEQFSDTGETICVVITK